jgi:DNA-binding transcriptional LysR family regulator
MNILKYMAFIKTVECGSFTKASDVLNTLNPASAA